MIVIDGVISDQTISVSSEDKVSEIRRLLGLQKPALKIFKQVREVKDTEIVGELFNQNDEITIFNEDYQIEIRSRY